MDQQRAFGEVAFGREACTGRIARLVCRTTLLGAAALLGACAGERGAKPVVAHSDVNSSPTPLDAETHALHNVHRLGERIVSGAVPEGDAAFDELRNMGIRTIISVDGATPDIARAQARGMRYVHIPTTYAEVTQAQRLEIARAIRDLPGPVFIHCHHGKHRGPAAAAAAAITLGEIDAAGGIAFMKTAGTAPNYQGLYACVSAATPEPAAMIDSASGDFPAVRRAHGMVAAMIEVDLAYEHLGHIRAAGWTVPKDHPDLVPAAEAGRLTENLRISLDDPASVALGDDFMRRLRESVASASALEEGIVGAAPRPELESSFKLVQASCKDCHKAYRDNRPAPVSPLSLMGLRRE